MRKSSWSNVAGQFSIEICLIDRKMQDINDKELPTLQPMSLYFDSEEDTAELIIDFRSSGFEDPGSMYGGPDNLGYPPEGEDERLIELAYLKLNDVELQLTNEQQETLFDIYENEINDVELEWDDHDH